MKFNAFNIDSDIIGAVQPLYNAATPSFFDIFAIVVKKFELAVELYLLLLVKRVSYFNDNSTLSDHSEEPARSEATVEERSDRRRAKRPARSEATSEERSDEA